MQTLPKSELFEVVRYGQKVINEQPTPLHITKLNYIHLSLHSMVFLSVKAVWSP